MNIFNYSTKFHYVKKCEYSLFEEVNTVAKTYIKY